MVKHTQIVVGNLPTNCLSVFDHFVILALKELRFYFWMTPAKYIIFISFIHFFFFWFCSEAYRRYFMNLKTLIVHCQTQVCRERVPYPIKLESQIWKAFILYRHRVIDEFFFCVHVSKSNFYRY